ncbi:hypothetical protein [Campylobacter magnus]|nr:hypothetical protein [Campylobacter magnus]MDD0856018.1 hypothetical protein [Campylobacter magnus]
MLCVVDASDGMRAAYEQCVSRRRINEVAGISSYIKQATCYYRVGENLF